MGSVKSLRYEVLVYQTSPKEQQHQLAFDDITSSNSTTTAALFETKFQRFKCDRENMQQYWIPEGYHPVLIPRSYFADSLVASSNNPRQLMNPIYGNVIHQLRFNNDNVNDIIELRRRRRKNLSNINNNNNGISKKKFNRTILGQSPPTNTIIKLKEKISAIRNSAVSITSSSNLKNHDNNNNNSPAFIIGEMWKKEPESIKKHYERLSIRKKLAQALAFEQKISSPSSRRHLNAAVGMDAVNRDSFCSSTTTTSSSPILNSRPIPDWMSRSDDDYDDDNSSCDTDATK